MGDRHGLTDSHLRDLADALSSHNEEIVGHAQAATKLLHAWLSEAAQPHARKTPSKTPAKKASRCVRMSHQ